MSDTGHLGGSPGELESLVAECLRRMEIEGEDALEATCRRYPARAEALRARVYHMRREGLLQEGNTANQLPGHIGPYRILEILGEGGMGTVYLAEQRSPVQRRVAIKVVKIGMDSAEVLTRFEAERQAMARMQHSGIARLLDAGSTAEGRPYFVMEHVSGLPITDYCDKHRLDTEQRLRLLVDVCMAAQHAHERGVVHRDLKPSNILVALQDDVPSARIIDFGIAKATQQRLTERTLFTEQGRIIGTPEYMSPEQAEPTGVDVDGRSDVYSLGVVMYELLVGLLPFPSDALRRAGFLELLRTIREVEPPCPSRRLSMTGAAGVDIARRRQTDRYTLRRRVRGDLDLVTMKALEKDPARRYPTPAALAEDIERHLRDEPILARAPTTFYRLGRFLRRTRARLLNIAIALIALLIGMIVMGKLVESFQWTRMFAARATPADVLELERRGIQATVMTTVGVAYMTPEAAIQDLFDLVTSMELEARVHPAAIELCGPVSSVAWAIKTLKQLDDEAGRRKR